MRVALISAMFPPLTWAEATHAFLLTSHLANSGIKVGVVRMKGGITPRHPGVETLHIIRGWSWAELPQLLMKLRSWSPDAILLLYSFSDYGRLPMITYLPTVTRSFLPRTRFVTFFQNADGIYDWFGEVEQDRPLRARLLGRAVMYWAGSSRVDAMFGTLLRDSHRLVLVSDRHREALMSRDDSVAKRTVVVPIPPLIFVSPIWPRGEHDLRRERLGLQPADFVIVFFGYIYPAKGVETLIRAIGLLATRRQNVKVLLVGGNVATPDRPAFLEEMQDLTRQLAIDEKVVWTGDFPWDSLRGSEYLRAADLCVLPFDKGVSSHNSSLAAAMVHGLPVITTRGETLEDVFVDGENVVLCPPKSPEETAKAIETAMDSAELRQKLSTGSLNLAQKRFSWTLAVDQTVAALS